MSNQKSRAEIKQIINECLKSWADQTAASGQAMILSYNRKKHTADVLVSKPHSNTAGDFYSNVPCPIEMGFHSTAPEPGRMCYVAFKGHEKSTPVITSFVAPSYALTDIEKQTSTTHDIPSYVVDL